MSRYTFCVCICTRNRPDDLRRALESLRESTYPISQVIVSDDGTDARSAEMCARDFPAVQFVEGPRRGLCANRNRALTVVTGSHVLFLDDDATLSADFFEKISAVLDTAPASSATRFHIVSGFEIINDFVIVPRAPNFYGVQINPYTQNATIRTFVVNATAFPVELFSHIGFDENLTYGCDELDLANRAVALGATVTLCPEARNNHYQSTIHRQEYFAFREASRLYVTFKRYWYVDRAKVSAVVLAATGPLRVLFRQMKLDLRHGPSEALRSVTLAAGYLRKYARARTDGPPR